MGNAPVQQQMGGAPYMGSGGPGAAAIIAPAGAMPMMNAKSAARVTHGMVGGVNNGSGVASREPMLNSREELAHHVLVGVVSRPKMLLKHARQAPGDDIPNRRPRPRPPPRAASTLGRRLWPVHRHQVVHLALGAHQHGRRRPGLRGAT
jgi:hypothetical protein